MKGCLKQTSRAPSPAGDHPHPRKTVAFDADGSEQVFVADEWDRTPAEPARNLSYEDILELKEIQRSLPRAQQPADLIGGRPASQYLSTVPIGLLPLLPGTDNAPPTTSDVASTHTFSQPSWRTLRTPAPSIPTPHASTWHPQHLSHLPAARTPINRQKPKFAFLPLLETSANQPLSPSATPPCSPPPSELSMSPDFPPSDSDVSHDPPTPSLTNASLDSSPLSRASSCSPEPPFFQLPPSKHLRFGEDWKYTPPMYPDDQLSDGWISDHHYSQIRRPGFGVSAKANPVPIPPAPSTPQKSKKKKKNVILVNDIEIELDDEGEEEEENTPPAKPSPSLPRASSSPSSVRASHSSIPSPSTSPTFSLSQSPSTPSCHAPMSFKRTAPPTPSTPPTNKFACSPPRGATPGGCSSPVLVPSA